MWVVFILVSVFTVCFTCNGDETVSQLVREILAFERSFIRDACKERHSREKMSETLKNFINCTDVILNSTVVLELLMRVYPYYNTEYPLLNEDRTVIRVEQDHYRVRAGDIHASYTSGNHRRNVVLVPGVGWVYKPFLVLYCVKGARLKMWDMKRGNYCMYPTVWYDQVGDIIPTKIVRSEEKKMVDVTE